MQAFTHKPHFAFNPLVAIELNVHEVHVEKRTSRRSCVTSQNHYTTVQLTAVAATSQLYLPEQLTAGRCCTKLVIIETHDLAVTYHFMLTQSKCLAHFNSHFSWSVIGAGIELTPVNMYMHDHISAMVPWVPNIPAPLNGAAAFLIPMNIFAAGLGPDLSAQRRHACVCEWRSERIESF